MTPRFPFVQIPRRVIYIDDDGKMLDALRMTMQTEAAREFINSPDAALQSISQEMLYWTSIEMLLATVQERRMDGFAEARQYVESYFRDWRRFHLTGVLIVDYNMPGMNGLELLKRISACPARRVLLTGVADAEIAVRAFNSGLIHKFIPKNTPNLYGEIQRSSEDTHLSVCEHMGHLMRGTLRNDQIELLHDPCVIEGLLEKIADLDWYEYVVVGQPFGLLGMPHGGPLQWLQLETAESLLSLSEGMRDLGYDAADVRATAGGEAMVVAEIRQQLGLADDRHALEAQQICVEPSLYCAVVDLPVPVLTAKEYGVDDIRSPEELMRALLRDVLVAARRAEEAPPTHAALTQAIAHLAATAGLSKFHAQALEVARRSMRVPDAVSAAIAAAIATQHGGSAGRQ
jgi:CheY-like chemotaxis protein